jgi:ferrochelatase
LILQALALKMALEAKGLTSNVYVGMRYWFPFTEEAVQQVSPYTLDQM